VKKILFVVHRYYPYPGGSEYYVKNMAEETLRRGHEVWVYSDTNKGDQNGVRVTSDPSILLNKFDLIVVHGDCTSQNLVLSNIAKIPSPVLYMLIKPGNNEFIAQGLANAKYVSYSTPQDKEFIKLHGVDDRMRYVPHGIPENHIGENGFKKKYGIVGKMILSCGGFWQHKGHMELSEIFEKSQCEGTLVITGYWNNPTFRPQDKNNIKTLLIEDYREVLSAIKEADMYVMNSTEEGFGLVLLESMLNKTPWASKPVGGSVQMSDYGIIYNNNEELINILNNYQNQTNVEEAYNFVKTKHMISNTVDCIMECC
jgi:glycosyltransferase involved in cell wall biosynthesis